MGLIVPFISNFSFAQNPLVKQWDYRFGGIHFDQLTCFRQTLDGGYLLGGNSGSGIGGDKSGACKGNRDYWIVKIDSLGIKQWDKDFGGFFSDDLFSLWQTTDGGYILGGRSTSNISGDKSGPLKGTQDYWIVKTNSLGIKQWDKDFGGTLDNQLYSIRQTSDGGYILGGNSTSGIGGDKTEASKGNWDYWIVKTDSFGIKQWDKDFGGSGIDWLSWVQQTADGGYILGGYSTSDSSGDKSQKNWDTTLMYADYWIVKIDSLGIKQWDRAFGGFGNDNLYAMQQTSDGGYILGGVSHSDIGGDKTQNSWGGSDYWIVKVDSLGIKQWDKDIGGASDDDKFGNISQTFDKGYFIAGNSDSHITGDKTEDNLGPVQAWVVKTDSVGNIIWDKTIWTTTLDDIGLGIQTMDGCYAIANYTDANVGGYKTQVSQGSKDYWIVKFCDTTLISFAAFNVDDNNVCEKFCINFTDQSVNNPTAWQWFFPGGDPSSSGDQNPINICYNIPGTYDVTLITTNANGNDSLTLHNYITVTPTPPFPIITQGDYTLTSTPANSYQWQLNATDISGATNQSYTVFQTGYYTVVVGDSNGCKNSATTYVLISGVDDVSGDGNISIYPNPATDGLMVELLNGFVGDEISISILNTLGQKIYSSQQSRSIGTSAYFKKEIDLQHVASGVYFLEIKTESGLVKKKIIITK